MPLSLDINQLLFQNGKLFASVTLDGRGALALITDMNDTKIIYSGEDRLDIGPIP